MPRGQRNRNASARGVTNVIGSASPVGASGFGGGLANMRLTARLRPAGSADLLEENLGGLSIELTPGDLARIEQALPKGAARGTRYPDLDASRQPLALRAAATTSVWGPDLRAAFGDELPVSLPAGSGESRTSGRLADARFTPFQT